MASDDRAVRFQILGPVRATVEGGELGLGGPRRRALAAFLLLRHGRATAPRELIEALWGEGPPPGAAATLRSHLSQLGREIGGHRIRGGPNGYALHLASGDHLDADVFRREAGLARDGLAAGDAASALEATSTALARWHGAPLAGLEDHPWAREAAAQLSELHAGVVELDLEARLAAGKAGDAAGLAEAAVREEPLRERRWAHLMLALYRCGRQADALAAYQRLREILVQELGIEPTAEVRDLEARILAQDPALHARQHRDAVLPPDLLPGRLAEPGLFPMVGRDEELAVLRASLKEAATRAACRLAMIAGEPGIGKTRLCREAAVEAADGGGIVLYGRCDDELRIPFQPWAEILSEAAERLPEHLLAAAGPELARLSPALARRVGDPPPPGSDASAQQAALFAEAAELLGAVSASNTVLLVVDDLQWADRPSLLLLRHLLTTPQPLRMLIAGTYRDTEVDPGHPLAALLADLHRHPGVTRLALSGLTEGDLSELLAEAAGSDVGDQGAELARRLRQEAGGNPFFMQEILQHLYEAGATWQDPQGHWQLADRLSLPASVREVVDLRVRHLGEEAHRTLRLAAVIGREFDLPLLSRLLGAHEENVLDTLEHAVAAGLVSEAHASPGRFGFRHDLIQSTLYSGMGATRRARTHRRVAEALEVLAADSPTERVGELAHHWLAADPPDAGRALRYCLLAGDRARARLSPDEALRWYEEAQAVLGPDPEDVETETRLLVGLGDAQRQAGDVTHRTTLLRAARQARALGRTDLLVAAALANNRGGGPARAGAVDAGCLEVIDAALAAIGEEDSSERAVLLALRGIESSIDHIAWRTHVQAALAVARRLSQPAVTLSVLNRSWRHVPDTLAERLDQSTEAIGLAEALEDPVGLFWALQARAVACIQAGALQEAATRTDQLTAIAERVGQAYVQWMAPLLGAAVALLQGEEERAEHLAELALERGRATGQPETLLAYAAHLSQIRLHQGRLAEVEPMFRDALAQYSWIPGVHVGLAWVYCELDRLDDARAALAPIADDVVGALPQDESWSISLCHAADVAARLHDTRAAAAARNALLPWSDQFCFTPGRGEGAVAGHIALAETALGMDEEAEASFRRAAEIHRRMGTPYLSARTALDHGLWLLRPGGPPEARSRGHRLLADAVEIAQRHGYEGIARRAAAR